MSKKITYTQIKEKLDLDLSDALWEQKNLLNELADNRILALTPERLLVEQKMILAQRELFEKTSSSMMGLGSILASTSEKGTDRD